MDKHQRDYCRSKPDKKKTCHLPTNLDHAAAPPQHHIQLPHRYDQPVNLTAGVKDISISSIDLGHTNNAADISQQPSSQQGLSYDSFPGPPQCVASQ